MLHDIDFLRNNVALKTGLCKKQSDEIVELPEVSVTGKKDNTFCGKKREQSHKQIKKTSAISDRWVEEMQCND